MPVVNDTNAYRDYKGQYQESEYTYDPGYLIMPVADGGYIKVRVHQGIGTRTVNWSSVKNNNPPVIPTASDIYSVSSPNTKTAEIVGATMSLPMPVPAAEGDGYNWVVKGSYEYILTTPQAFDGTAGVSTGAQPVVTNYNQFLAGAALAGVAGAFSVSFLGSTDPDSLQIDFSSEYSWNYGWKLGKQFFSDGLIGG